MTLMKYLSLQETDVLIFFESADEDNPIDSIIELILYIAQKNFRKNSSEAKMGWDSTSGRNCATK
jgi:hypothetical protein